MHFHRLAPNSYFARILAEACWGMQNVCQICISVAMSMVRYAREYSGIIHSYGCCTQIGLKSLVKIQRGYVFIGGCPALCYTNTVSDPASSN